MTEEFHPIRDQIIKKISSAFSPLLLEVIDDSQKHVGHAGHDGKGESHFRLVIVSEKFVNQTRIARHQMVYAELNELIPPIHALQIKAKSPNEVM